MTPKISILIPTHNQARYITRAVESAVAQNFISKEVIISDDASTDATQSVLEFYQSNSCVFINRNDANLGRVGNYRKCLYELARGEWVVMLDGDDYFIDDSYISKAIQMVASDPQVDLIFSNIRLRRDDKGGTIEEYSANSDAAFIADGKDLFFNLEEHSVALFHSTCLYRRHKAIDLNFYRYDIVSSDWESLHRYILTGKVAFLPGPAAVWRWHTENASQKLTIDARIQNLQRITGPCNEAKNMGLFDSLEIDARCDRRMLRAEKQDIQAIIKSGKFTDWLKYMKGITTYDESAVMHWYKLLIYSFKQIKINYLSA
jgi:glycosyltransferase involved in cell wall biosynthesis